jgi:hypothetical protein
VPQIDTPPPNWPGKELQTQGTAPGASAQVVALDKGMRTTPHTPVNFDLGEHSENFTTGTPFGSCYGGSRSRPLKTEFPRFDGDNPKWWKKFVKSILTSMM